MDNPIPEGNVRNITMSISPSAAEPITVVAAIGDVTDQAALHQLVLDTASNLWDEYSQSPVQ